MLIRVLVVEPPDSETLFAFAAAPPATAGPWQIDDTTIAPGTLFARAESDLIYVYYYVGLEGQTLHLLLIERAGLHERSGLPILLPVRDGQASLKLTTRAGQSRVLKLRVEPDGSLLVVKE